MADHRQRAEGLLSALSDTYIARSDPTLAVVRPEVAAQMAIAHALLALGDQIAHDWEDPDA
jgi:hypothetical protein